MKQHIYQSDWNGKDWFRHLQLAHVCLMLEHKIRLELQTMPANFGIAAVPNWLYWFRNHYDFAIAQFPMPLP